MKIGICGAGGRMGREVCKAVTAEPDFELVCAVDPAYAHTNLGDLVPGIPVDISISADMTALVERGVEAMVDFSIAEASKANISYALGEGIHCVVGTTGINEDDLKGLDEIARQQGVGCLVVPNFAIGAVLMMDFARRAGRHLEKCEIIELHHPDKLDAPSGTARGTAHMILQARGESEWSEKEEGPRGINLGGIRVHSVRLPGLVAHQEVIFGGLGQTLIIRHDSIDRTSFMPGVIIGLRKVTGIVGLVVGLDKVLDL